MDVSVTVLWEALVGQLRQAAHIFKMLAKGIKKC